MFKRDNQRVVHNAETTAYQILVFKREMQLQLNTMSDQIKSLEKKLEGIQNGDSNATTAS